MFKSIKGRMIVIALVLAVSGWQLYSNGLKLGLDLQGGMHLVLEVDDPEGTMTAEARSMAIDQAERIVRSRIDELGVEEPLIQKVGADRLIVELAGIDDSERAREIVQRAAFLQFKLVLPRSAVEPALPRIDNAIVQALGPDSVRALGASGIEAQGSEEVANILLGLDTAAPADTLAPDTAVEGAGAGPGADTAAAAADTQPDPGELRPFTSLLQSLPDQVGEFLIAVEDVPLAEHFLSLPEVQRVMPRDVELAWGEGVVSQGGMTFRSLYVLEEDAFMTGDVLEDAQAGRDPQMNQPQVRFELSRAGGRNFSRFTTENIGNHLAILLDDEVISAPVIRDRIGQRGQIDLGGAPIEEARDLALVLRAGALPAPLAIEAERTVGPSLGQDSIDQGQLAGILGLILVIGVMAVYYRMAGLLAIGALGVYVLLVLGGLAGLNATLTLPGIAGLILSVGMAVDANVLIFERIREELDAGRATRTAVDQGFGHALSAIVDANITTLITALILFQFGTGPVRGFAVTLSIGIVASFFSALYVTRSLFLLYLRDKRASDPISI